MTRTGPTRLTKEEREAKKAMEELADEHGLNFTLNPGGGCYSKGAGRCQVGNFDYLEDLRVLTKWLHVRQLGPGEGDER